MTDQDIAPRDRHLDIPLDDEEPPTRATVYVDAVVREDTRIPIIPASFHGWANIKATLKRWAGMVGYRIAAHSWRAVLIYTPLALFWSIPGLFKLIGRQLVTAQIRQAAHLMTVAAGREDSEAWHKARKAFLEDFRRQLLTFAIKTLVIAAAGLTLWLAAPRPVLFAVAAAAVPLLAHIGRPRTMPIVRPVIITPRYRRLNADIVLRAYYAAGLGSPDKPGQQIQFPSTMQRDNKETGSHVLIDLPYGKGWKDLIKPETKSAIASGLDVHINQVFFTKDKTSERRHRLFVSDQDPLAVPVGVTDLLDCKPRNIWRPMKLGRDERNNLVTLLLIWQSVLVGAQPRKGKTFTARLIALFCALDPWVKLIIADGKKSSDWEKFRLVAHRFIVGTHPSPRDDNPVQHLTEALDEILAHIDRVNDVLAALPPELCPEGVLTEELTRDPRFPDLRFWVLIVEEFQVYFETEDQDVNKQIAAKLSRIQATGPSAGVIVLSSSQKPSGVGAGDVGRLFNRYRDNHQVRFALKCGNRDVSIAVLGGDSYQEGFDASALPAGKEYRGVGYLYGVSDETPTVRTFLADHVAAEKILVAARRHREQAGTLSGLAAGEVVERDKRDVMADARTAFFAGEARVSWPELAARMKELMPQHYADLTPAAISAQLRALGVVGKSVKDEKHFESGVGQGFDLASLDEAIAARQVGSGSAGRRP